MFVSENIYKDDLNLFNYQNHMCYIKDINKHKNKSYFCLRCLNSFISEENLSKHKYLCLKYN